jgi:trans-2-enoyl-CoA reductase
MEQTIYKEGLNKLAKKLKPFINGLNDEEYQEFVDKTLNMYQDNSYGYIVDMFIKEILVFINGLDSEEIGEYCTNSINEVTEIYEQRMLNGDEPFDDEYWLNMDYMEIANEFENRKEE